MFDNKFSLSDIRIEVIETADKYMKAVLINTKNRYFRVLRKTDRDGHTVLELEKYESNLAYEESGFAKIDNECFLVGGETIEMERSDLTDALRTLTQIQLDVILKSILLELSQEEIAAEYGISTRMVRKHKHTALAKLRRRLTHEA